MRLAVAKEVREGERRVALVPECRGPIGESRTPRVDRDRGRRRGVVSGYGIR